MEWWGKQHSSTPTFYYFNRLVWVSKKFADHSMDVPPFGKGGLGGILSQRKQIPLTPPFFKGDFGHCHD